MQGQFNLFEDNLFKTDGDPAKIVALYQIWGWNQYKHILSEYIVSRRDIISIGKASFIWFQHTIYKAKPITFDEVVFYMRM